MLLAHRQKLRTFCSRIHWSAEYVILQWDKNKMAARTSKRSRERQVPCKKLNDLSSVDLLYEEKSKRKRSLNKSLGIFAFKQREDIGVKADCVFFLIFSRENKFIQGATLV